MLDVTTLQKFDFGKIRLTILALLFLSFSGFSQNCDGDLSVYKDRNTRSADEDGALFTLELRNSGGVSDSFQLEYKFLEEPCANKNRKSNGVNVPLNVQFKQNGSNNDSPISLSAGSNKSFQVYLTVPPNTKYDSWSCVEVQVRSSKCGSIVDTEILKVYVPDPTEN